MKSTGILGLTVQENMKWNEHIHYIVKKAGKRLYMLRLLKKSNASTDTLITVYITIIRPVLEYACQVWHYSIQHFLSEDIVKLKNERSKSSSHYKSMTNIMSLRDRREKLCEQFFEMSITPNNFR